MSPFLCIIYGNVQCHAYKAAQRLIPHRAHITFFHQECFEHLGLDDTEIVIGEWWLVFDQNQSGTIHIEDFKRMINLFSFSHIRSENLFPFHLFSYTKIENLLSFVFTTLAENLFSCSSLLRRDLIE